MEPAIICCKLPKCKCNHLKFQTVEAILVARTKWGFIIFLWPGSLVVGKVRLSGIEVEEYFRFSNRDSNSDVELAM